MDHNTQEKNEYLKLYRELHYSKTRKIVTFPLLIEEFVLLQKASSSLRQSSNAFAKNIVTNFLLSYHEPIITDEQKAVIREYIRISRGIANNINQLSYRANIGEYVDVNILFSELKRLEDGFSHFIANDN
jgi:hypothetical protein